MRTLAMTSQGRGESWLMLVALGFAALTALGASLDGRGAPRRDDPPATMTAPLTNEELVIEMLTHD